MLRVKFITLTRLALVLLLSSSGMGKNTAKATQFAKMVNRMIISKALEGGVRVVIEMHGYVADHQENLIRLFEGLLLVK